MAQGRRIADGSRRNSGTGLHRFAIGLAIVVVGAGACTEDPADTGSTVTSGANGTGSSPGSTSVPAADNEVNAWALSYTGGRFGSAQGEPVRVGYVNQEDLFPEATIGVDAAVDYLNAELGGFDGRPIELVRCAVTVEEDGQRCGTQLANDDSVNIVLTGTLLVGADGLYNSLDGRKPVLVGNGLTTIDFTTTAGYSLFTGAVGVVGGLAHWVATEYVPKPDKVAVMYGDNASAQGAFATLMRPVLEDAGIDVTGVQVRDPGGTAAEIQTAIQNSGADTADVFITLTTLQSCIATYDSLRQLGVEPTVVTTGLCFGTPMTDHIRDAGESGDMPNGWYFGQYGYNYFEPDLESGILTYVTKVREYGTPSPGATSLEYTGFAGPLFSNLMTVAKFVNELGVDNATPEALFGALRSFRGPMMLQVGPIRCGDVAVAGVAFPAVCASQMGIIRYVDGEWESIADGLNGRPVDAATA